MVKPRTFYSKPNRWMHQLLTHVLAPSRSFALLRTTVTWLPVNDSCFPKSEVAISTKLRVTDKTHNNSLMMSGMTSWLKKQSNSPYLPCLSLPVNSPFTLDLTMIIICSTRLSTQRLDCSASIKQLAMAVVWSIPPMSQPIKITSPLLTGSYH